MARKAIGLEQQKIVLAAYNDGKIKTKDYREDYIIRRRFGIDCVPERLEEIGHRFEITLERVRQIVLEVLKRSGVDPWA
jgi:DNA-directed RNA polymerase sigma subunit (sigma70/sigma32)